MICRLRSSSARLQQCHYLPCHGLQLCGLAGGQLARLAIADAEGAQRQAVVVTQDGCGIEAGNFAIGETRQFQLAGRAGRTVHHQRPGLQNGLGAQRMFASQRQLRQTDGGLAVLELCIDEVDRRGRTGTQLRSHGGELGKVRVGGVVQRGIASQCGQPFSFVPGRCGGAVIGVQNVLLGCPWR